MTLPKISAVSTLLLISASLTGCGGGSQMPSGGMPPATSATQLQTALPQDRGDCHDEDGVKVTPCRVKFDANHTDPRMVTITTGDNDHQSVKERDDCAARNIATLTKVSNHHYTVTPGTATGSCEARFERDDHGRMGHNDRGHGGGELEVVNAM